MSRIDVDGGAYTTASDELYSANHGIVDAISTLASAVGSGGAMAGSDSGGEGWAAQYDATAGPLLKAGADLGEAMGQMANLLNAALKNHEGADFGARLDGPPTMPQSDGDSDSSHWTETVLPASPPSAKGGTGDLPGWLHWVVGHLEGLLWPDADTGKLRNVGSAWTTASETIGSHVSNIDTASSLLGGQRSPEVADAKAAFVELKGHLSGLVEAYHQIGSACTDYAQQVDDHHRMMEDELASFIEWTLAIEAGGALLAVFTLGISEAAAQAAEAAEVANAASKVVRILTALLELARTAALTIAGVVTKAGEILAALKKFLSVKVVAAAEKIAPGLMRNRLLEELARQGIKHTPEDVLAIWKNADGKIVFLEKGNANAGLAHIIGEHGAQFAEKGISEAQIPSLLQEALTNSERIGFQPPGTGRPIYEVLFNGKLIKVAITVGGNGYIVGANVR